MEQLITNDDRAMHDKAILTLRTAPDYDVINNMDIYLLQFAYVLIANAKLAFRHGCDSFASLELSMPEKKPLRKPDEGRNEVIKNLLSKIIDERIMESFTLNVSSDYGKTSVYLEVYPLV